MSLSYRSNSTAQPSILVKEAGIMPSVVGATDTADIVEQSCNKMPPPCDSDECFGDEPENALSLQKSHELKLEELGGVEFSDEIKIDFIRSVDYRIMCRFLGVSSVNDIKNHPYESVPLISLLLMESLTRYMESEGYRCVGELNFSKEGESIPPDKAVWTIKGKERPYTTTGFKYFEKEKGKRKNNVVFWVYYNSSNEAINITCFTTSSKRSENIIRGLEDYTKKHNCLRGAKLRNVNVYQCSFSELESNDKYNWDNYYYPQDIKDLFELEVFGFLKDVDSYNKEGINKRGVMIFGRAGTGKTTIGHVICNYAPDYTVVWITPEMINENNRGMSSMKVLYRLADFVSPCVFMLEDLDLYGEDRDTGHGDMRLGALMNILDGVNSVNNSITIGTTNRIEAIEKALRNRPGRFDRVVEIPSLEKSLRKKMFTQRLKGWKVDKGTIEYLVGETNDWTGAEAQEFVNTLSLNFIQKKKKNKRKKKVLDITLVSEVIETMRKFGIGEKLGKMGFGTSDG